MHLIASNLQELRFQVSEARLSPRGRGHRRWRSGADDSSQVSKARPGAPRLSKGSLAAVSGFRSEISTSPMRALPQESGVRALMILPRSQKRDLGHPDWLVDGLVEAEIARRSAYAYGALAAGQNPLAVPG